MKKVLRLLTVLVAVAVGARAQEIPAYEPDARLTATLEDGNVYEASLLIAQSIEGRDWLCIGAGWIFDDEDRSKSRSETSTHRETRTVTTVDPETLVESTETIVVETPETVTITEPGAEYDGVGLFATTPVWGWTGRYINVQVPFGGVISVEDPQNYWAATGLSATFLGGESKEWTFFKWQATTLILWNEGPMYYLGAGMVY